LANALLSSCLLPLVIEILATDPLASGDMYPGDLLQAVLELPQDDWYRTHEHRAALALATQALLEADTEMEPALRSLLLGLAEHR
jgi:hypothetical protein